MGYATSRIYKGGRIQTGSKNGPRMAQSPTFVLVTSVLTLILPCLALAASIDFQPAQNERQSCTNTQLCLKNERMAQPRQPLVKSSSLIGRRSVSTGETYEGDRLPLHESDLPKPYRV